MIKAFPNDFPPDKQAVRSAARFDVCRLFSRASIVCITAGLKV
jgi:hypothetical protein